MFSRITKSLNVAVQVAILGFEKSYTCGETIDSILEFIDAITEISNRHFESVLAVTEWQWAVWKRRTTNHNHIKGVRMTYFIFSVIGGVLFVLFFILIGVFLLSWAYSGFNDVGDWQVIVIPFLKRAVSNAIALFLFYRFPFFRFKLGLFWNRLTDRQFF